MKTLPNEIFFAEVEQLLSEGRDVVITVQGNSMRPFILNGRTRAVLAACDRTTLTEGDVVLFRYRGRHVLHRIVERHGDDLVLAGDGNYRQQERCRTQDVAARMKAVISAGGRTTDCDSRPWRWSSAVWLRLPAIVRRAVVSLMRRAGF